MCVKTRRVRTLGRSDAALVGRGHAFDRAKHRNIGADVIVETRAGHRADGAALAGCRKGEVLFLTRPPDARVIR